MSRLKEIENGIKALLAPLAESKLIKVKADPELELGSTVRQAIIINISFVSETFVNSKKSMYKSMAMTQVADYVFKVKVYFKDLRGGYDKAYDIVTKVQTALHGQQPLPGLSLSPISVDSIEYLEKTENNFYVYEIKISIRGT